MKRLLFVATNVPPAAGGPSSQFNETILYLSREYEICVVIPFVDISAESIKILNEAEVCIVRIEKRGVFYSYPFYFAVSFWNTLKNFQPEYVFLQTWNNPLNSIILFISKFKCLRTSIKLTGLSVEEREDSRAISLFKSKFIDIINAILVDKIWVTSESYKNKIRWVKSESDIIVHPNFLSANYLNKGCKQRKSEELKIITIARLKPWKGLDKCLEIFRRLDGRRKIIWTFIGTGDSEYALTFKQRVDEINRNTNNTCQLLQINDTLRTAQLLSQSDLFILLSDYEPFGIVFLEAMAVGCRVIGSNVGGIPEVLGHGSRGVIVDAEDLHSVETLVLQFGHDIDHWDILKAQDYALSLSAENCVAGIFNDLAPR